MGFKLEYLRLKIRAFFALRGRVPSVRGGLIPAIGIFGLIEDREDLEILFLGYRIVFVIVALSTAHCHAHPNGHRRVDTVDNRYVAKLFVIRSAFVVRQGIAMEGRGDPLIGSRGVEQVPSELLDGELVEGHVGIEGSNDPVAISPNGSGRVVGVPSGVCVAGQIQPATAPMFAVGRSGQEPIDEPLVGQRIGVVEKRIEFVECRG